MLSARHSLLQTAANFDLWSSEGRQFSHHALIELFHDLQNFIRPKCFLEFGAFDAKFSRRIKQEHPNSSVIAFEANTYNYKHFTAEFDFKAAGIEYKHLAISDQDGTTISFQVQKSRKGVEVSPVKGDDSLLKRNVSDPHEIYHDVEYETLTVDAIRLDTYCNDAQFGLCDFGAWIDVEGALRTALSGAKRTLERTRSLMIEVEEKPHWAGQWMAGDVEDFLSKLGFIAVARDFEYEDQYNIIFVKKEVLHHFGFNRSMTRYYDRIGNKRA